MADLIEKLSSNVWNDRKEALGRIDARLRSSACSQTEATDLIHALLRLLSTNKHQLMAPAANIVARAANSMGQDFAPLSKATLGACLAAFRTNKPFVVTAIRAAADATFNTLSVDSIADSVLTCLSEKTVNPSMTEEAVSLLGRALNPSDSAAVSSSLPVVTRRTIFRRVLPPLAGLMEARSDGVREAACVTIATARHFLADDMTFTKVMSSTETLDDSKKGRIEQTYQRLFGSAAPKKVERPLRKEPPDGNNEAKEPSTLKRMPSTPTSAPAKKMRVANPRGLRTPCATPGKPVTFITEQHMPEEEIKRHLGQISVPEACVNNLSSRNWRERLDSIGRIHSAIKSNPPLSVKVSQCLIRLLTQAPGFKEVNVQVLCRLLETVAVILDRCRSPCLCDSLFETLMTNLVGLICNVKNVSACEMCLTAVERNCGLGVVGDTLLRILATTKAPKSIEQSVLWLANAVARNHSFRLNYAQTVKCLKEGFNNSSEPVRHAYVRLAGAVYVSLEGGAELVVAAPAAGHAHSAEAFSADLEGSCKPVIAALLRTEFAVRQETVVASAFMTPLTGRAGIAPPASSPLERHSNRSRRTTTVLETPSTVLQRSQLRQNLFENDEDLEASSGEPFAGADAQPQPPRHHQHSSEAGQGQEDSPVGLSSTFCAAPVSLLVADFRTKKTRLAQLATGNIRPSRQRLEGDFMDAGMHANLRRLLTLWDTNPVKTQETLVLLTQLLLQRATPGSAQQQKTAQAENPISEIISNTDLLFQWMVEACFNPDSLNPDVVTRALDYLDELVSRLADAEMTLSGCEIRILLPWPLLGPQVMAKFFARSQENCRRLSDLLFRLCRVVSATEVYSSVMDAVSTATQPIVLTELLHLVARLLVRFPSLPDLSVADIKSIAQHAASSDKALHRAALECLKHARNTYTVEQISNMAGNLTERDRAFLEDALSHDHSAAVCQTPVARRVPAEQCFSASYTNNPSILASVSRSQMRLHRSNRLENVQEDDDGPGSLREAQRCVLDILEADDRAKEDRMVTAILGRLLFEPVISQNDEGKDLAAVKIAAAKRALFYLDFLHQSTATRDLLLPQAPNLFEGLGAQLSHIALGNVPAANYSVDDARHFVLSTLNLVVVIFQVDFLTREMTVDSLGQLLSGLLHLHTALLRLYNGQFDGLSLKGSLLLLLVDIDIAKPLKEDLFRIIQFLHSKLVTGNLTTYILALTQMISSKDCIYGVFQGDNGRRLLAESKLLLHLMDKASKQLAASLESFPKDELDSVRRALKASNSIEGGDMMLLVAFNRLNVM